MAKTKKRKRKIGFLEGTLMQRAVERWLDGPGDGMGAMQHSQKLPDWAHGPRFAIITQTGDHLIFYLRPKTIGYRVVAVWNVDPRERIWSEDEISAHELNDRLVH